ncbi:MAG: hypothetical protein EZS28_007663 [Streblomastix strix]|uniref:Uncharacterized protein n=1 Tax=Streblomastix strix TaxID=222440 RepID=A0A5J4WPE7_9EUKA|nr:MAG: hypothetical protein EZS28_007663 [Streblomastix strix]
MATRIVSSFSKWHLTIISTAQDTTAIIKLYGAYVALIDGVNITYYPSIAPLLDVLPHPNSIDALHVFSIVLDILKPLSQPATAEGFNQILPEVIPANDEGIPAFKTQFQTNLEVRYYELKQLP